MLKRHVPQMIETMVCAVLSGKDMRHQSLLANSQSDKIDSMLPVAVLLGQPIIILVHQRDDGSWHPLGEASNLRINSLDKFRGNKFRISSSAHCEPNSEFDGMSILNQNRFEDGKVIFIVVDDIPNKDLDAWTSYFQATGVTV